MCTHSGVLIPCQREASEVTLKAWEEAFGWSSKGLLGLLHTIAGATTILMRRISKTYTQVKCK